MRTGAVVTAANITERDENINAFDDIAVMSAPERIVATLKKCGIDDIIVVTGYDAKLRKRMRHLGLSFAENKGYDVTDVLQSAKLGLEKIYRRCDRVLFCPSGYPFFGDDTVRALVSSEGDAVIPSYGGKKGHPLLIDSEIVPSILTYEEEGGMSGAVKKSAKTITVVPVDDMGCVSSKSDEEEIKKLIDRQNPTLIRPQIEIGLAGMRNIMGTQMKQLLIQVDRLGSVREASESVGISYSAAWNLIKESEEELGSGLIDRQNGGRFGGTARLTGEGRIILDRYIKYEEEVSEFANAKFDEYFKGILGR